MKEVRKLLEFDKVVGYIKQKALCPLTVEMFDSLPHLTSKSKIETQLNRVTELRQIIDFDKPFPLEVWDLRHDIAQAAIAGNALKELGLVRIYNSLAAASKLYGYLKQRREKHLELWEVAGKFVPCKGVQDIIVGKIDLKSHEVKSNASPKLGSIRKSIKQLEHKAQKALETLNRKYANLGYLQDSLPTIKDGRLVFSVKKENKNRIAGLIHDYSSTGQTCFIEPLESLQMNNEIQNLRAQEREEIDRILREITALIHVELPGIIPNFETLCEFDFIHAKAMFSREFECAQPELNEKNLLDISAGKHPLLMKTRANEVVPLNMSLPTALKTVVITGPNAGGKSVAMKTVGLLILMTQAGIPAPLHPDSKISIFHKVFADIGDFQSIENDLSTFTSHITRIATILQNADSKSLVLMDEIGVGTDPAEGSALSISLLEDLTKRGAKTIVTTHHGSLKAFAHETDGVDNASMEFQLETLTPTYKFKAGVPGSSYALEICQRLGLPQNVLTRSRELLGEEKQRLENLILELDQKTQESERLQSQLKIDKAQLQELTTLYEGKMASLKQHEREAKKKALTEAEEIIANANATIENAVKEIREKQAGREVIAEVKQTISDKRESVAQAKGQLIKASGKSAREAPANIERGELVHWKELDKTGTILEVQGNAEKALVQFDSMKFWVPARELRQGKVSARKQTEPRKSAVKITTESKSSTLPSIDLRGNRVDEGLAKADKFLDDALLAGWEQVRIIHGKGTGALREAIMEFLKKHPKVRQQKMGAWNEGDMGVTVVDLM